MPLVRRTRAILRSAEFGFFGVIVRTWRQTPRFCGAPGIDTCRRRRLFQFLRMAGALTFFVLVWRPWRTSWLIVGTKTLLLLCHDGAVWRPRGPVLLHRWTRPRAVRPEPVLMGAGGGRVVGAGRRRAEPSRGQRRGGEWGAG